MNDPKVFEKEEKWLTASIFSPAKKLHFILAEIKSFQDKLEQGTPRFSQIRFDKKNGDNIQFSVALPEGDIDSFGAKLDRHFAKYFSGIKEDTSGFPITSMHLPYPTNTLQFGLHKMMFEERSTSTYKSINDFSLLIPEALTGEVITHETLTFFSFYLQVALIKVCARFCSITPNEMASSFLGSRIGDIRSDAMKKVLVGNLQLMQKMAAKVLTQDKYQNELHWLNAWIASVNNLSRSISYQEGGNSQEQKINAVRNFYLRKIRMVHYQLGLDESAQYLLFHLLDRSI